MGTAAHELPMIIAAMLDPGKPDPEWLRQAQRQVINDWWEQYGWGFRYSCPTPSERISSSQSLHLTIYNAGKGSGGIRVICLTSESALCRPTTKSVWIEREDARCQ